MLIMVVTQLIASSFSILSSDSLISYKNEKQYIIYLFSTIVEYHNMSSTTKEIVWLQLADICHSLSSHSYVL